jgi:hypothetical protein
MFPYFSGLSATPQNDVVAGTAGEQLVLGPSHLIARGDQGDAEGVYTVR